MAIWGLVTHLCLRLGNKSEVAKIIPLTACGVVAKGTAPFLLNDTAVGLRIVRSHMYVTEQNFHMVTLVSGYLCLLFRWCWFNGYL